MGTPVGDYGLPVVTGGTESQEGGGIARAWILDLKVYPGYQYPMTVVVPERKIYMEMQKYLDFNIFMKSNSLTAVGRLIGRAHSADVAG